jgi:hypothetical protein
MKNLRWLAPMTLDELCAGRRQNSHQQLWIAAIIPAIRGNNRQSGGEEAENISGLRTTSVTGEVIAQP